MCVGKARFCNGELVFKKFKVCLRFFTNVLLRPAMNSSTPPAYVNTMHSSHGYLPFLFLSSSLSSFLPIYLANMAENIYTRGTRVWFTDKEQGWISAEVTQVSKGDNESIKLVFVDERGKVGRVLSSPTGSGSSAR